MSILTFSWTLRYVLAKSMRAYGCPTVRSSILESFRHTFWKSAKLQTLRKGSLPTVHYDDTGLSQEALKGCITHQVYSSTTSFHLILLLLKNAVLTKIIIILQLPNLFWCLQSNVRYYSVFYHDYFFLPFWALVDSHTQSLTRWHQLSLWGVKA